jgi:dienelactone hydrolase
MITESLRPSGLLRLAQLAEPYRAGGELAAFAASLPRLRRAPHGDGHPVLVLPGLLASDESTQTLRWYLRDRGYQPHGWDLGVNRGPDERILSALPARLRSLATPDRPVSLIGWSLGGLFALELAGSSPGLVRQVITLGSPLARASDRARQTPVPVTAVFSMTDTIVSAHRAVLPPGPYRENVEVEGSHIGLGHNPQVLLVIADRLVSPPG